MAKTANKENVSREVQGPDYKGAIKLIRGAIASNQSESASLGQENSTHYKRIDKQLGIHRGAAKTFATIDNMPEEKREDYLRSLFGLLDEAGFSEVEADLVDQAEKPPVAAVVPPKGPEGNEDLAEAGGEPVDGEADGNAVKRAMAKAKKHLQPVPDAVG